MMLGIVLPLFQVGSAAVGVGIAEAAVQASIAHVTHARFEEAGQLAARICRPCARRSPACVSRPIGRAHLSAVLDSLESPGPATQLMVLEAKAVRNRGRRHRHRAGHADVRRRGVRRRARNRAALPRRARAHHHVADERTRLRVHRPGAVRPGGLLMSRPLKVGAVMYDPKVSVIWEIIRDFFDAQHAPIDVAFYNTYETQVDALLDWHDRRGVEFTAGLARRAAPVGEPLPRHRDARHRSRSRVVCRSPPGRSRPRADRSETPDDRDRRERFAAGDADPARPPAARRASDPELIVTVRRFDVLVGKHGDHVGGERDALECLKTGQARRVRDARSQLGRLDQGRHDRFQRVRHRRRDRSIRSLRVHGP